MVVVDVLEVDVDDVLVVDVLVVEVLVVDVVDVVDGTAIAASSLVDAVPGRENDPGVQVLPDVVG